MSVIKDGVTAISPGQTLMGTHEGRLINTDLVGQPVVLSHDLRSISGSDAQLHTGPINRRTIGMVMRNTTGALLTGGMIVKEDLSAGLTNLGQANALCTASARNVYVVDPLLGADAVADDDLFIAHVRGPSKVLMNGTGVAITTGTDTLVAGASGFPAKGATPDTGTLMGTFLETSTATANKDTKVAVLLHPDWE